MQLFFVCQDEECRNNKISFVFLDPTHPEYVRICLHKHAAFTKKERKKDSREQAYEGVCLLQIICDLQLRSCPMTIIYYLSAKGSCCQHDFSKVFLKFSANLINYLAKHSLHPQWQCIEHKYAGIFPDWIIQIQSVIYHLTP